MDIIKKIDENRVKRGWTFYKLSQESGLSQQTFTQWFNKKTIPTIPALKAVWDAFGISLANFFSETNTVEISPGTKSILDNWNYLTKDERDSIKMIINNYIKRKE